MSQLPLGGASIALVIPALTPSCGEEQEGQVAFLSGHDVITSWGSVALTVSSEEVQIKILRDTVAV